MPKKTANLKAPNGVKAVKPLIFGSSDFLLIEKNVLKDLAKSDPKLAALMKKVGRFKLDTKSRKVVREPFQYLIRSILYQQLHGKAAASIHEKLRANFGGVDPTPEQLAKLADERFREAGVSRQKMAALRDLARAANAGGVPNRQQMKKLSDDQIIELLVEIRGVGRWTVEMLLIFGLGRTDVLAVDDYAIKKATMLLYGLKEMPKRKEMQTLSERWKPYRSVASWYLWRSLD